MDQNALTDDRSNPHTTSLTPVLPPAPTGASRLIILFPLFILFIVASSVGVNIYFGKTTAPIFLYGAHASLALFFGALAALAAKAILSPYVAYSNFAQTTVANTVVTGRRYELAVRGAAIGFWDYDIVNGQIYFSGQLMSILGYPDRDRSDKIDYWYSLIHPNDLEGVQRTMAFHLDRRTPDYFVEYRIKKESGEFIWVEDRGRAVWGSDGKPMRAAGVMKDVSNEKRVQSVLESRTAELEEARVKIEAEIRNVRKFKMAVDSSTEGVSITTPEGAILYINPAWSTLNGWSEEEVMGQNEINLLRGDEEGADDPFRTLADKLSVGASFTSESVKRKRKSGVIYHAQVSIYPLREDDRTIFLVSISQDITQRKEVDRAKTEFVSLASHQLRTPLSAIRWYSEMLLSKYAGILNEKQKQYVEEIYAGNLRMVDLVNALLNTSRIDLGTFAIEPEDVNPVEICHSVIKELTPQVVERKQHIGEFFSQAPTIYRADPKLLRVIFQNFLSNSVKYTPEGGLIEVEIRTVDNHLYIRVSDNGYGIPKGQESQIFKKLFRADNVRQKDTEGTGLGLYIVKAIVEASGGAISFASEENKGTTFHVYLPLSGMPRKTGTKGLS